MMMKYVLVVVAFFYTLSSIAQTAPPIIMGSKLYEFKNGGRFDSALFTPRRDTTNADVTMVAPGMIQWRPADQSFYGRDSTGFRKFVSDGSLSGYVPTTRSINTTSPLLGGGNLTADRTLSIQDAAADGSTKGAASFTAADFNASAGNISIDYTNGQAATGSTKGFLTATDWTTFNNKVGNAESGLYKSGNNVRLGTNNLLENANIPLNGFYFSLTGNGAPLGTGATPAYDLRHENNQAGIVGIYTKNNNKSGAAVMSFVGDSVGVAGGIGFYGRTFAPAFDNSYTQPGFLQVNSGSQANGVVVRSVNPNGELRFTIDTMNVAIIDSSVIVPGKRSIRIRPQSWPEGDLEIVNVGNTIVPDSTIHGATTGLVRFNWATMLAFNTYLDLPTSTWKRKINHLPSSIAEVGREGVTLHATTPYTDISSRLHELLQARGEGLDGGSAGAGTDTGKFIQVKVPLAIRYSSAAYTSDNVSWESGDLRPMLWLMSEESKAPEGEFARIEQCSATAGGGHLAFRKSRGTMNVRAAGLSGDNAGFVDFYNFDGSNYVNGARITSVLEANASAGSSPTAMRFDAGSSSGTLAERMRITSGGNLLINTTAASTSSRLTVAGATSMPFASVSTNTTLDNSHSTVRVTSSGVTITLPAANTCGGRIYKVINYNTGGNINVSTVKSPANVDITTIATGTILTMQADGTGNVWYQIN